jgi:SAM-dependent methyltransferase
VFAGQAFHWFANDAAVREIARVLRPDGVLALLWNEALDPSPLPPAYRERLGELHDAMRPAKIEEDILRRSGLFRDEVEEGVEHEQVSSRDDVLAFAASVSWIASRDDREAVLAELAALLPEGSGSYRFRLRASMAWTRRV